MFFVYSSMPFKCTRTSLVCHSYVLVFHSHVTRMYLYAIHMSLVYTRMSSVCHLCITRLNSYVSSKSSYVICMSLVCNFTINQIKNKFTRKSFSFAPLELVHIKSSMLKLCPSVSEVKPVII